MATSKTSRTARKSTAGKTAARQPLSPHAVTSFKLKPIPEALLLDQVKSDFRNFLYLVWKHLHLPDPTPVQYDIAEYLQSGPTRCVIEAFRGVGKSWITSAFVLWLLLRDPQLKVLVVSASKERADAFSVFTKRLIEEMPMLAHLRPRQGQRDSNIAFDVGPTLPAHAPSVKSVGITGQLTGSRADIIIPDDVEVPKNSITVKMRERLAELVKEFDSLLSTREDARIIFLGTPQTEMSLYNVLPDRGYEVRIWPARVPDPSDVQSYRSRLAPMIQRMLDTGALPGTLVDPSRFTDEDLLAREASYGRSGFRLQFMLNTKMADAERYPLKLSDLMVMDLSPEMAPVQLAWGSGADQVLDDVPNVGLLGDRLHRPAFTSKDAWEPYTGVCMYVDPSGRGKDETGYAVVAYLGGRLFLLAAGGFRGGYTPETLEALAQLAKRFKVNVCKVEPNFGDGMFKQLLIPIMQKVHPCSVEDAEWSKGQKELRIIDTLEPVLNQHRLVVDRALIEEDAKDEPEYQLFYQLTRITRERGCVAHDDRIEALAGAVRHWLDAMSKDASKELDEHRERKLNEELDRFMEVATGRKVDGPRWMTIP